MCMVTGSSYQADKIILYMYILTVTEREIQFMIVQCLVLCQGNYIVKNHINAFLLAFRKLITDFLSR